MSQKQYRPQGDPKRNDTQGDEEVGKEAAIQLPPVDDLLSLAGQALAKTQTFPNHLGMPCPVCCKQGCSWPITASPEEYARELAASHCNFSDNARQQWGLEYNGNASHYSNQRRND